MASIHSQLPTYYNSIDYSNTLIKLLMTSLNILISTSLAIKCCVDRCGYIFEPQLHVSDVRTPKWKKLSRLGQFREYSPGHSTAVSLMHNVVTGNTNPHIHVVFDYLFSTIATIATVATTLNDPN